MKRLSERGREDYERIAGTQGELKDQEDWTSQVAVPKNERARLLSIPMNRDLTKQTEVAKIVRGASFLASVELNRACLKDRTMRQNLSFVISLLCSGDNPPSRVQ